MIIEIPNTSRFEEGPYFLDLKVRPEDFQLMLVYGTLLPGRANEKENQGLLLANFETIDPYAFVVWHERCFPGVLIEPPNSFDKKPVEGKLYLMSGSGKAHTDRVEQADGPVGQRMYDDLVTGFRITSTHVEHGLIDLPPPQEGAVRDFVSKHFKGLEIQEGAVALDQALMYKVQYSVVNRSVIHRQGLSYYDDAAANSYKTVAQAQREARERALLRGEFDPKISPKLSGLSTAGTDFEPPRISRDDDRGQQPPLAPNL